jgi:hypothetical protein
LLGLQNQYTPTTTAQQLSQLQMMMQGTPGGYPAQRNTSAPQTGLMDLITQSFAPALETSQEQLATSQRGADISNVASMGPQANAAIAGSNPAAAGLLGQMTRTASSQVGMGSMLDPSMMRLVQQGIRARQSGTLTGTGNAGDYGEALGLSQFGNQMYQQRLGNANSALGMNMSLYGDPFQRVLGRSNNGLAPASGLVGQAGGVGQSALSFLNPESSYAQDLYNTNYNGQVTRAIGNANNNNALISAGIKALGSIVGAGLGAI